MYLLIQICANKFMNMELYKIYRDQSFRRCLFGDFEHSVK